MNQSKIGVRYAKALFQTAVEDNSLEAVRNDMTLIAGYLDTLPVISEVLKSPVIKSSQKFDVIEALLGNQVHANTYSLIKLLIANKREARLFDVVRNFTAIYRKEKGIVTATVSSPVSIDAAMLSKIAAIIQQATGKTVEMSQMANPDLIGGFVLRVDDMQFDSSLKTRLNKVKQELMNSSLENK